MSRRTFVATIPLIGLGLSSAVCAQGTAPAEQIGTLFQNVRIFDGKSDTLSVNMNVLVRGNTIEKISQDPIPTELLANTKVIAGVGRTLMPGLIDMHWHTMLVRPTPAALLTGDIGHLNLVAGAEARDTLLRGFTTVRDMGGPALSQAAAIDEGTIVSATYLPVWRDDHRHQRSR
jgi:imidazolonepropionase-like amidohydrolase